MNGELEERIESAIGKCADMVKAAQQDSQKALHYSQAALNLAHTESILENIEVNRESKREAAKKAAAEEAAKKTVESATKKA